MSIAVHSLAGAAICEARQAAATGKTPRKRQAVAKADSKTMPEPR